jgi:hypothetical protein
MIPLNKHSKSRVEEGCISEYHTRDAEISKVPYIIGTPADMVQNLALQRGLVIAAQLPITK